MEDAREVRYGISFETGDAGGAIDEVNQAIDELDNRLGVVKVGAQQFGAGVVSAYRGGQNGARDLSNELVNVEDAAGGVRDSAQNAGDTARQFGQGMREAGEAARNMGRDISDAGGNAEETGDKLKKAAEGTKTLGAAFQNAMADGLEAGQSIARSFRTGLAGAIDFSRNKVKVFVNDTVKGAQSIADRFKHPIKTIRADMVKALRKAGDEEEKVEKAAKGAGKNLQDMGVAGEDSGKQISQAVNQAENSLNDMGDAGEDAGSRVSEAIKSALSTILGIEAIKAATEKLMEFGTAAVEAFKAGQTGAAQFDAMFTSDADGWVDNYSDAVHRSKTEVQSFMVESGAMNRNMGLTAEASEELSKVTPSLAYDLGNAFQMDDAEALSVLQSAIEGDTAALTKYGVTLDDAALSQSALQLGLSGSIDEMDDASAAQVRLNAVLMQSGAIQEAAVEQAGGLANSTKRLKGVLTDFMTSAGDMLAPALEGIINTVLGGVAVYRTCVAVLCGHSG